MVAVPGLSNTAAGDRKENDRGRRSGLVHGRAEAGRTEVQCTGPGKAVQKSSEGYAARRQGRRSAVLAATRAASHGGPSSEEEEGLELRSPGNQSGSDEEAGPLTGSVRSEEHGRSAEGSTPVQPGKLPSSMHVVGMSDTVGVSSGLAGSAPGAGVSGPSGGTAGLLGFFGRNKGPGTEI